jgi:hypothetical protein
MDTYKGRFYQTLMRSLISIPEVKPLRIKYGVPFPLCPFPFPPLSHQLFLLADIAIACIQIGVTCEIIVQAIASTL